MAKLAKNQYGTTRYVYDALYVGFIKDGFIYWHLRKNLKYQFKAKVI